MLKMVVPLNIFVETVIESFKVVNLFEMEILYMISVFAVINDPITRTLLNKSIFLFFTDPKWLLNGTVAYQFVTYIRKVTFVFFFLKVLCLLC